MRRAATPDARINESKPESSNKPVADLSSKSEVAKSTKLEASKAAEPSKTVDVKVEVSLYFIVHIQSLLNNMNNDTVCPRSIDTFYMVSY